MKALLLVLISLLTLAPQDPKTLTLSLADGSTIRAQVLELSGDRAKLKLLVLGGSMQVTRALSDFTSESAYRIREEFAQADSFDEHFALAKQAADHRLLRSAGAQARAAIDMVKGTPEEAAKTVTVRTWAADELEEMTREAVEQGDLPNAKNYLKILSTRLSDLRTEEQLDALAGLVDGLDDQVEAERADARQAKLETKQKDEIRRRLDPITKRVDAADKLYRQAVAKSRNTSQSSGLAARAIENYKVAWTALQDLQKKFPDDADLAGEVLAMGTTIGDSAIRAALHAANVLTVQSDYKNAMEWCDKILAFQPDNAEARDMKRTIQVAAAAASSQWGWGWRVVGGPTTGQGRRR